MMGYNIFLILDQITWSSLNDHCIHEDVVDKKTLTPRELSIRDDRVASSVSSPVLSRNDAIHSRINLTHFHVSAKNLNNPFNSHVINLILHRANLLEKVVKFVFLSIVSSPTDHLQHKFFNFLFSSKSYSFIVVAILNPSRTAGLAFERKEWTEGGIWSKNKYPLQQQQPGVGNFNPRLHTPASAISSLYHERIGWIPHSLMKSSFLDSSFNREE